MTHLNQPPPLPNAQSCPIEYRTAYPNPNPAQAPAPVNFGMQAAKASWMAPIVGIILSIITNNPAPSHDRLEQLIIGISCFAIYILGLVLGIIALTRIPRYGSKGILAPAIAGVVINGLLVAAFTFVIVVAMSLRK